MSQSIEFPLSCDGAAQVVLGFLRLFSLVAFVVFITMLMFLALIAFLGICLALKHLALSVNQRANLFAGFSIDSRPIFSLFGRLLLGFLLYRFLFSDFLMFRVPVAFLDGFGKGLRVFIPGALIGFLGFLRLKVFNLDKVDRGDRVVLLGDSFRLHSFSKQSL